MDLLAEFDRQLENLIKLNYPQMAAISSQQFIQQLTPLKNSLARLKTSDINLAEGTLPFVIVVAAKLIPVKDQMEHLEWGGKKGVEKLHPHIPTDFVTINSIHLPPAKAYLLIDINRGKEFLNIRPEEALKTIQERNQTPLTIEEGIAVVTQFPEFLFKNNCFSLLGSRVHGNQRVPAIWINGDKQANLGWCWDRNPHTWLGSAFAKKRLS
jgi:hypothetical protein